MHTRFTKLTNEMTSLGKEISNGDQVRKFLRSLPASFDSKVNVMKEAHDLSKMAIADMLGSLMAFELKLQSREAETSKKDKGKGIALKAMESDSEPEANDEDDFFHYAKR